MSPVFMSFFSIVNNFNAKLILKSRFFFPQLAKIGYKEEICQIISKVKAIRCFNWLLVQFHFDNRFASQFLAYCATNCKELKSSICWPLAGQFPAVLATTPAWL